MGKPSGWEIAKRVWKEAQTDDVFGNAAQLSYYFLLAIFPFLILLTTMLGMMAKTGSEVYENLISYAREMLPYAAFTLVTDTLKQIQAGAGGGKVTLGILGSIWAAAGGMSATINGLNRAYEVKEGRAWWKVRVLSVSLTILLSAFLIVATALILYGTRIAEWVTGYFGLETYFAAAWKVLQWPVSLIFIMAAFMLLYRYAPDVPHRSWRKVLPGAIAGMILWVIVSLLFRLYLQFFNSYNATYGSLGAVIVLLLWFYLSGASILLGAELNAELEKIG